MSFHSFNVEDFEAWKQGIKHEHTKPGWDMHDSAIRGAVSSFQQFNGMKSGYVGPTWQLIKAMIWTEGGGPRYQDEWTLRPMQIGKQGDLGIVDVVTKPGIGVVTPPEIRRNFQMAAIRSNASLNIQAGLVLLHLKLSFLGHRQKSEPPAERLTLGIGDVWDGARNAGDALHGRVDRHAIRSHARQTSVPLVSEPYVMAWLPFHPIVLYQRYNVGDAAYARKLECCMELMNRS